MSTDKYYVYEHWRPDEGVIFYVGKGHARRAWDMRRGRNPWHKFIIAKLKAMGLSVDVRIINKGMSEPDAFAREIELIAHWRGLGAVLVNLTDGGEGASGYKFSEERKRRVSEQSKGRKPSPEARAKMSAAAMGNKKGLGKKKPQHVIDAMRAHFTGKPKTEETKRKISEAKKGKPWNGFHAPELLARRSAEQKGIPKSEETKARMRKPKGHGEKIRALMTGVKRSEETRKKISENSRLLWEKRRADGTIANIARKIAEGIAAKKNTNITTNLTLTGMEK